MQSKVVFFCRNVLAFHNVELLLCSDMEEKANTGNENDWKFNFPANFGDIFVLLFGKITADN